MSLSEIIRIPGIWPVTLAATALVGVQFTLVNYLEIFLQERLSMPIRTASYLLVAFQLAGVTGRIIWGILSDSWFRGARKPVFYAAGAMAIGMSLSMLWVTPTTPLWVLAAVAWFSGFSAAGWNGLYVALISDLAGKDNAGTALGISLTILQVGTLVIPTLFGHLADRTGSFAGSWIFLAILILTGLAVLSFVREKTRTAGS